jgi:putative hydroxymethylpyrimidine transporter CytX
VLTLKLPPADGIEPVPDERRVLGFLDQGALWANLGVSLVGIVTGAALVPSLGVAKSFAVLLAGGLIGAALLAASAWLGASTALPAMAIMRRALGVRGARVPTVLNILQNTGWSAVETWTVAEAARALPVIGGGPRLLYYLIAGLLGMALAVTGPLSVVRRLLRRYVTPLLVVALAYLLIRLGGDADFGFSGSGGLPVMVALDIVVAYNASWLPLAPDYTRFSDHPVRAALGAASGYFLGTSLVFAIGFLVGTVGSVADTNAVVVSLTAMSFGALAVAVLVADESEKTFANVYSTAVSIQNLVPHASQRLLVVAVGTIATVIAFQLSISRFFDFLLLLGAIFVPLFGAVIADHLRPARPAATAIAWVSGFLVYEWLSPATVHAVFSVEQSLTDAVGAPLPLGGGSWGASVPAFAVAFGLRIVVGLFGGERHAVAESPA